VKRGTSTPLSGDQRRFQFLQEELDALREQQIEALKRATIVGMNSQDVRLDSVEWLTS